MKGHFKNCEVSRERCNFLNYKQVHNTSSSLFHIPACPEPPPLLFCGLLPRDRSLHANKLRQRAGVGGPAALAVSFGGLGCFGSIRGSPVVSGAPSSAVIDGYYGSTNGCRRTSGALRTGLDAGGPRVLRAGGVVAECHTEHKYKRIASICLLRILRRLIY